MAQAQHWGEFVSDDVSEYTPDVTGDIERSMNNFFLEDLEYEDENTEKIEKIMLPSMDPLMLHAIALHKYAINVSEMIDLNKITNEMNIIAPDEMDMKLPSLPDIPLERRRSDFFFNNVLEELPDPSSEPEVEIPELNRSVIRQILTKCIATMFAHIGYESSQQSALDLLTDVLEDFFGKILRHYKVALEDKEQRQLSGFPHTIERVLVELGMGGVKGLNDYYQSRVVKYVDVLHNRCKELHDYYQTLRIPRSPSPIDKVNKVVRVKVEEEDVVEVENPEVHFSTIEGDVNFSILETGYQLLNSLEAEANLQSLGAETEEDIAVTQSPGVVSISSESELSHLSPYSKKKRFGK